MAPARPRRLPPAVHRSVPRPRPVRRRRPQPWNSSSLESGRGVRAAVRRTSHTVKHLAGSSPARSALTAFALVSAVFTALLSLPFAARDGHPTPLHDAMFTAVSAVSVTGLTTVNTAEHWSTLGHVIILVAIQIGGLGILSMASLLTLAVSRHLGVRSKLLTQEGGMTTGHVGEVGKLLRVVVVTVLTAELILTALMAPRFIAEAGSVGAGLWHAVFYAVSAFNNAGFSLHPNGLSDFAHEPYLLTLIGIGVFVGALGFPVVLVLMQKGWRYSQWNLHTKLTVEVTLILLALGAVFIWLFEHTNPNTLGPMTGGEQIGQSLFASVMTRSGGFSVIDVNAQTSETLLLTDALMFVGGGSASTAGGIKVTTLAVMFLAIVAEARGDKEVTVHGRTIAPESLRVAIAVLALGATLVLVATLVVLAMTTEQLQRPLFEAISAFATCGLSTGLSAELPPAGVYVLTGLMFAGRVGTITFAAALALRQRRVLYRYPVERPILG
ncbi:TrkH family potassium uptake protein [Micrococcus lylae]|uniref:TrkH family potassium uptake protein n=1 Tax=Micrococcus lylae TaxID=1273 RepID=UPI000C807DA6|nr:potassium transporter TrkG [Micrococcus lylae]WIK81304.1 potassium transporter TrkG [Micrococcus lylae]